MLLDRGMEVDHTSIFRWIQTYAAPGCCQRQHGVGHRRQPDCSTKPDALTIHLSVQNVASITRMLARVVLWFDFPSKITPCHSPVSTTQPFDQHGSRDG